MQFLNLHWDIQNPYEESPIDSCNTNLKENPELALNKDCFLKKLQFSLYMHVIYMPSYFWMLL